MAITARCIAMALFASLAVFCGSCSHHQQTTEEPTALGGPVKATPFVLIDTRSAEEYASGHLEGAILIPHDVIADKIATVVTDKTVTIYVYCRSGRRSGIAQKSLMSLGYEHVTNLGAMEAASETLKKPIVK